MAPCDSCYSKSQTFPLYCLSVDPMNIVEKMAFYFVHSEGTRCSQLASRTVSEEALTVAS